MGQADVKLGYVNSQKEAGDAGITSSSAEPVKKKRNWKDADGRSLEAFDYDKFSSDMFTEKATNSDVYNPYKHGGIRQSKNRRGRGARRGSRRGFKR
ncbi:hypothetical protein AB6A40_008131 [Gnathostoma spinigerum]|uniref:Uncharacterized protein n=1 Tax=Gnathostoma spinigerum TaxID=75299 RepID=A0ABD6EXK6_9BILA